MTNLTESLVAQYVANESPFCINFDDAWKWCGYSKKSNARRTLVENFERGVDFSSIVSKTPSGGRSSELILLTSDCFKSFAMMAGTDKGKEIRKYFIDCEKRLKAIQSQPQPKPAIAHYTQRVMDIKHHLQKPPGTWCVIEHCAHLLLEIEAAGYPVHQYDLLDGSVGKQWSHYRTKQGITAPIQKALYSVPQKERYGEPIHINAFPYEELGIFREWLETIYIPHRLPAYLGGKYGQLVKA